jgi:thymidylate kinase
MSDEKIHITISGAEKSGKTTIARIIADALKRAGFADVVNLDRSSKSEGLHPIESDRVRRFAEGRRVVVLTAVAHRQALQRSEKAQTGKPWRASDGVRERGHLNSKAGG